MTSLTEFLLARIAEDEASARANSPGESWEVKPGPGPDATSLYVSGIRHGFVRIGTMYPTAGDHMARWDPSRVLAECEAKRRIVELALQSAQSAEMVRSLGGEYPFADGVQRTLVYLALVYADHRDYLPEWRPDPVKAE